MSMPQISEGALKVLYDEDKQNPLHKNPKLQLLSIKGVNVNGGTRYRVIVSDGVHYMQAMLAAQHAQLVDDGLIKKHSVIQITDCVCNPLQNKKLLIILSFDIVQTDVESRIGSPTNLEEAANRSSATTSVSNTNGTKPVNRPAPSANASMTPFSSSANMQLEANITPIRNLNPYQSRWHIKARVSQKSDIKKWRNARGDGQLFSVNLLDTTGEIKATAFNDQVDRLYNMLEEGKVYYISKARVTMAKKQFSTLNNEYELQFENATEIEACPDSGNIPQINFDFVKIADIDRVPKDTNIDVIGVVVESSEINELVSKVTGKPMKKRDVMIADESLKRIKLTLWDAKAEQFADQTNPVVAVKGVRVSDFGGRSLSLGSAGLLKINPDLPEAEALSKWYADKDPNIQITGYSSSAVADGAGEGSVRTNKKITLQDAKSQGLGTNDNPDYFSFKGTVVYYKTDSFAYPGCPTCRKKVVLETEGWRCEKCQKTYPSPEYRYILTMSVEDGTGQVYVNAFDEVSGVLIGMSANELMKLSEEDSAQVQNVFNKALWRVYNFKIRAKRETFNDLTRTKFNAFEVTPISYEKESQEMISRIEKYF
ncbi:replication factor-A protein [Mycotypha africana]|uniref:replication factor-A protein n=1 Tax=Mycotypha africana TaxID=64632 RepID=UPI002301630A|nr:replication factor-A protein [Mycotypha africana]KAI8970131.1 replication factor-A protein [Mycotypha africana]